MCVCMSVSLCLRASVCVASCTGEHVQLRKQMKGILKESAFEPKLKERYHPCWQDMCLRGTNERKEKERFPMSRLAGWSAGGSTVRWVKGVSRGHCFKGRVALVLDGGKDRAGECGFALKA